MADGGEKTEEETKVDAKAAGAKTAYAMGMWLSDRAGPTADSAAHRSESRARQHCGSDTLAGAGSLVLALDHAGRAANGVVHGNALPR